MYCNYNVSQFRCKYFELEIIVYIILVLVTSTGRKKHGNYDKFTSSVFMSLNLLPSSVLTLYCMFCFSVYVQPCRFVHDFDRVENLNWYWTYLHPWRPNTKLPAWLLRLCRNKLATEKCYPQWAMCLINMCLFLAGGWEGVTCVLSAVWLTNDDSAVIHDHKLAVHIDGLCNQPPIQINVSV